MNKFYTLLAALLITATTFAQSPESMSYQAVVRDGSDVLVSNSMTPIQISILKDAVAVYVETQTPTTNNNGLLSIEIGGVEAAVVSGVFSDIIWGTGTYFIKTEVDVDNNASYDVTGTSQLLSVPFALYAKDVSTGVFSTVGGETNYQFVGNNVWTQFADLSTSITIAEDAEVLISYNTANQHLSGQASYFLTRLTIDGIDIQGFRCLNSISNHQYSTNQASGVISLTAGTHSITVDYRTNTVDPNSLNNPSIEHMGRMLTVKELK